MKDLFAKTMIVFGLILGISVASQANQISINNDQVLDVAIVGGGISGLYAGYRLVSSDNQSSAVCQRLLQASHRSKLKIEIFELSDRLGGRIWSVKIPGSKNLIAEIGAMRFADSQKNITGLIEREFNLPYKSFETSRNIQYFRDHHFFEKDFKDKIDFSQKIPYFLPLANQGLTPDLLWDEFFNRLFPDLKNVTDIETIKDSLKHRMVLGQPLSAWNSRNIMLQVLAPETFNLIRDTNGYKMQLDEWNAYNFIIQNKISKVASFFTLAQGMQTLPLRLADDFMKKGGKINLNTKLYTFSPVETSQGMLIKIELGPPTLHAPNKIVYARNLILAIPKKSLTLLHPTPALFNDSLFQERMNSVLDVAASKIFLVYNSPWWEKLKLISITSGKSNTDLPLQQIYYFATEKLNSGSQKSLLLASYNDSNDFVYWRSYFNSKYFNETNPDATPIYTTNFPDVMLNDVQKQLALVHGESIPRPQFLLYMNWAQNPYGAGYHYWKVHARSWEIAPSMRHPFKQSPIFIVGESYATYQGWIEGAMNSSELMLEENFGMPRARWIPRDYNLGS